jgi:hypothetical protein
VAAHWVLALHLRIKIQHSCASSPSGAHLNFHCMS